MIGIRVIYSDKAVVDKLKRFSNQFKNVLVYSLNEASTFLTEWIKVNKFKGATTPTAVADRSGVLRASMKQITPPRILANQMRGGTDYGTMNYAKAHFGPVGTMFTIRRKNKLLAVPIGAGRNSMGQGLFNSARGTTLKEAAPQLTLIPKTPSNRLRNSLLVFKTSPTSFIPFYVLKEFVRIRRRINPETIVDDTRKDVVALVNKNFQKVFK